MLGIYMGSSYQSSSTSMLIFSCDRRVNTTTRAQRPRKWHHRSTKRSSASQKPVRPHGYSRASGPPGPSTSVQARRRPAAGLSLKFMNMDKFRLKAHPRHMPAHTSAHPASHHRFTPRSADHHLHASRTASSSSSTPATQPLPDV